jgi:hypothetical protein
VRVSVIAPDGEFSLGFGGHDMHGIGWVARDTLEAWHCTTKLGTYTQLDNFMAYSPPSATPSSDRPRGTGKHGTGPLAIVVRRAKSCKPSGPSEHLFCMSRGANYPALALSCIWRGCRAITEQRPLAEQQHPYWQSRAMARAISSRVDSRKSRSPIPLPTYPASLTRFRAL